MKSLKLLLALVLAIVILISVILPLRNPAEEGPNSDAGSILTGRADREPGFGKPRPGIANINVDDKEAWRIGIHQLDGFLQRYGRSCKSLLAAAYVTDDPEIRQELVTQFSTVPEVALYLGMTEPSDSKKRQWYEKMAQLQPDNGAPDLLLARLHHQEGQPEEALEALRVGIEKSNLSFFDDDSESMVKEAVSSVHSSSVSAAIASGFTSTIAYEVGSGSEIIRKHLMGLSDSETLLTNVSDLAFPWLSSVEDSPTVSRSGLSTIQIRNLEGTIFGLVPEDHVDGATGLTMKEMKVNLYEEAEKFATNIALVNKDMMTSSEEIQEAFFDRRRQFGDAAAAQWFASLSR